MEEQKVYLIPGLLSEEGTHSITAEVRQVLSEIKFLFAERAKTSRRMIKKIVPEKNISEIDLIEMDKHQPESVLSDFISWLKAGHTIGVMSESGMPCIADPGNIFVKEAHKLGIRVVPLTGPSSIFLALAASGLNGQQFSFHGYLPVKDHLLNPKLKHLVQGVQKNETQIFIETPYRNQKLFDFLIKKLPDHCLLCLAIDITGQNESITTKTISSWKKQNIQLEKVPTIFCLGK